MGIVLTLLGLTPPARYDGTPWYSVAIQESASEDGPYAAIDTVVLDPPDTDPTQPATRNLTTTEASLPAGWYQVQFLDVNGGQSGVSAPIPIGVEAAALPPDPVEIRSASPLLRQAYASPSADPQADADLAALVKQATVLVQSITWRLLDPEVGDLSAEGYQSEACPTGMIPLAISAITRMAERIYVTSRPQFAQQIASGRRLRGFSAGPYSEQYFAPNEFQARGRATPQARPVVDQDDALDTALWALMTEDARDYFVWRATGAAPPLGQASTFDYRRQSIGYTGGGPGGWGGGLAHGGPDGF